MNFILESVLYSSRWDQQFFIIDESRWPDQHVAGLVEKPVSFVFLDLVDEWVAECI